MSKTKCFDESLELEFNRAVSRKSPDRCCGNCALWKQKTTLNKPPFGDCQFRPSEPLPMWFRSMGGEILFETDGINCNAFTPKAKNEGLTAPERN